jgi:hypothetical protein
MKVRYTTVNFWDVDEMMCRYLGGANHLCLDVRCLLYSLRIACALVGLHRWMSSQFSHQLYAACIDYLVFLGVLWILW